MIWSPSRVTRTDTRFPCTTLFRSRPAHGRLLGTRAIGIQRRAVLPCYRAGRGDDSDQREIWQRPGPQGIQPRVRSICAVRNPGDPGKTGRASCRERVGKYVYNEVVDVSLITKTDALDYVPVNKKKDKR